MNFGYTNSTPLERRGTGAAVSGDPSQINAHYKSIRDHDSFVKASSSRLSPLLPRVIISFQMANHWQLAVDSFELLPPAGGLAVEVFRGFYDAVEAHALTFQEQFTTDPVTSFAAGDLRIDFYCALGHIPWPFIRAFAVLMRMYTERGWTGFFEARATHLSGVSVFIRLLIE